MTSIKKKSITFWNYNKLHLHREPGRSKFFRDKQLSSIAFFWRGSERNQSCFSVVVQQILEIDYDLLFL